MPDIDAWLNGLGGLIASSTDGVGEFTLIFFGLDLLPDWPCAALSSAAAATTCAATIHASDARCPEPRSCADAEGVPFDRGRASPEGHRAVPLDPAGVPLLPRSADDIDLISSDVSSAQAQR
eukprot:CAMPEP_0172672496 /NCGR_PEP_ID=MMETSP1074-20121228/11585_1 /TAXON_ID=2916 /ORGANISM="Ceratium fusus, Strain PA161109" /LENGTH=121 /DNA_ID=CAMNT_0013489697 /DNA_START=351 /DNA_END=717 /DNA_ORIENTATION=+